MIISRGWHNYLNHLEAELLRMEQLYKLLSAVKERTILRQEEEIKYLRAKCERLEMLVIPGLRPVTSGSKRPPRQTAPEGETNWTNYLKRHMDEEEKAAQKAKEQTNGVHGQERTGVHQSSGGNAVRPNGVAASVTAKSDPSGNP